MAYYIFLTAVCVTMALFVNAGCKLKSNSSVRETYSGSGDGNAVNPFRIMPFSGNYSLSAKQEVLNHAMLAGIFIVLFGLSAMRVGIGNDYWTYRYEFIDIYRNDTPISFEIGFQLFVRLMIAICGVDNYIPIFAVVAFFTCFFFVKGIYDNSDVFVISFFLFMANGFYFMSFSNIRYYLVLALVVYSMKFVWQKRFVPFCLIVVFAAFFHMTVLLTIPAYILAYYLKWSKKTIWMIPAAAAALVFGKILIRRILFIFYPYYEGDAILDTGSVSYVNIAKCAGILVFCLIYYKKAIKNDAKANMLFNLNLFAFLLYTCATYIPELSRVCYYFVIGQIFLIPLVLKSIENRKQRILWTVLITLAYAAYFVMFLIQGNDPVIQILPYFSWFFS